MNKEQKHKNENNQLVKDSGESHGFFNINEAAKRVGVSAATIRNWEKEGLIKSKRRANNYRVFTFGDIETLKTIQAYSSEKKMNLSLIKEMLVSETTTYQREEGEAREKIYHTLLKEYRKEMRNTLEEVAQAVGISASYLSRVEQGKTNVSYQVLEKLARFYGESPLRFFDIQEDAHQEVVRKGEGKLLLTSLEGVVIHSLNEAVNRSFEVARFTIQPGCGDFEAHSHRSGNEFIFVITGTLQVTLDDTTHYVLQAQDAINFESKRRHQWHNPGDKVAEILWVHAYL